MIRLSKVKDLDKYFERLKIGISMSNMWSTLQTKSEFGSNKSEKGYQLVAMTMAGNIARKLNMNPNLAEVLTMCKGSFFPAYGNEGKKTILEYLKEHNIDIKEADLARQYIEYDLTQSGSVITPEFDEMLKALFEEGYKTTVPEVELAKVCSKTIEDIKSIDFASNINQTDLLYKVSKDVEERSVEAKKPTYSENLQKLLSLAQIERKGITEEKKKIIKENLAIFIENAGADILNGVYEYMGTDEIEF